jgi:hypothetical protein
VEEMVEVLLLLQEPQLPPLSLLSSWLLLLSISEEG